MLKMFNIQQLVISKVSISPTLLCYQRLRTKFKAQQ